MFIKTYYDQSQAQGEKAFNVPLALLEVNFSFT